MENKKSTLHTQTLEGVFFFGKNGVGFVRNNTIDHVIEIPADGTGQALHKDLVEVEIYESEKSTGYIGKVLRVIKRNKRGYVGILEQKNGNFFIDPLDRYNNLEIIISKEDLAGAVLGQKVFVTLTSWETGAMGVVSKILGDKDNLDGYIEGFALEQGFDKDFPEEVVVEADALVATGITDADIHSRLDIRAITTFTIDPDDAKDFDDALSFEYISDDTYKIGVHIADVSHYVTEGSALDDEAQERATSVYLVDRTIPMLPEALSNDLCSLRPNKDKLCFSTIFTLHADGTITDCWYGKTIISSDKRFTYEEAQTGIEEGTGPFAKELVILNTLAKHYRDERIAAGALTLEKEELRFVLDEEGNPLEVRKKSRKDAHKMIEEWMLLANRYVAQYMSEASKRSFMVYRVHDKPEIQRVQELRLFLKSLGYDAPIQKGVIPSHYLSTVVENAKNDDERDALSLSIARSMAKAIYTTENIGHYGLGFTYYTHFTSPIRRYPDIMVHRLLEACLKNMPMDRAEYERYNELANHATSRERDAAEAERTSIHYMQARYMKQYIGQEFDAMITGLSKSGIFLSERSTKTEGMAMFKNMKSDYFEFNATTNTVRGQKTGKEFRIGDSARVRLAKVDVENRLIDYMILE